MKKFVVLLFLFFLPEFVSAQAFYFPAIAGSGTALPVTVYKKGYLFLKYVVGVDSTIYVSTGVSWVALATPAGVGDITAVTAGDGLSGGGASGSVSLAVNPKLLGQTIAITSDSVHVKDASIGTTQVSTTLKTPTYSFSIIDTVKAADGFGIVKVPAAITITEIAGFTNTGTATFNIEQRAEATPNTAGTDCMTADLVADNDQQEETSFADATVPANTWLYFSASAVASGAQKLTVTIKYTKD